MSIVSGVIVLAIIIVGYSLLDMNKENLPIDEYLLDKDRISAEEPKQSGRELSVDFSEKMELESP